MSFPTRHRPTLRHTTTALAVLAALALPSTLHPAGAVSPSAAADPARPPVPVLGWQPCGPGLEPFLCDTVEVPADYDRPRGRTTTIALTKLPAGDPDRRIGTLFTNPGGPGGSGVAFVQLFAQQAYTPEVLARYDILGFDPRGVAGSDPATCFPTVEREAAFLAELPDFPVTRAEESRYLGSMARLGRRCTLTSGDRLASSSSANVARDMDLLRQAVGDETLHYVGYSYGTFLGATYARLFPDRVGRFVLDGTIEPTRYVGSDSDRRSVGARTGQGPAASETFGEFLRLCTAGGPPTCSLAALGDPAAVVEATFERLKSDPVSVPLPDGTLFEVTYAVAVSLTFGLLYEPATWVDLADSLAFLAVGGAEAGAAAAPGVAAVVQSARDEAVPRVPTRPHRGEDYETIGGALASLCADVENPLEPREYAALADQQDAVAPHFGRYRAWVGVQCEYLRVDDEDAYTGPWQQEVATPVLVIGTRFDPATPYDATQPYADLWPDARVLTVEGWGHTILGKSSCADEAVARYLVDGAALDGATCGQDLVPFTTPPLDALRQVTPPRMTPPRMTTPVPAFGVG